MGHAQKRVDGIAAAAVNDGAGGAEEGAEQGGVADGGLLVGEQAVAPGLQEMSVEILAGWLASRLLLRRRPHAGKASLAVRAVAPAVESLSISRRVSSWLELSFAIESMLDEWPDLVPWMRAVVVGPRMKSAAETDDNRTVVRDLVAGGCLRPLHFWGGQFATIPMKIHEYQAKEILRKYGVPVPGGEMATTLEEADTAAKSLFGAGNAVVVVKAQIHAGGRGKGGGVKVVKSLEDADAAAKAILGMQLVTHQTGPAGTEGAAAADRRGLGDRPRALSRPCAGPRLGEDGVYGFAGRRHGD